VLSVALLLGTVAASPGWAEESEGVEIAVADWLVLGPVPASLPAFHDAEGPSGKPVTAADLLAFDFLDPSSAWPRAGDSLTWVNGTELAWRETSSPIEIGTSGDSSSVLWLAAYLEADRFVSGKLHVETPDRARIWLDGEQVAEKSEPDTEEAETTGEASADMALIPGKHRLWMQLVSERQIASASAHLELAKELGSVGSVVSTDVTPERRLTVDDLLDVDTVTGLSVSGDGALMAVELAHPALPSDRRRSWVEIRRTRDGGMIRAFRGAPEISGFTWGPGRRYAYVSRKDDKATVWVGDLRADEGAGEGSDSGETLRAILKDVEHLGGLHFTPDGASLIYEVSEEPPEDDSGVQRMESLQDRWSGWRTKTYLHQVSLADGARRRLTAGTLSTDFQDVHPDGSRLLFSRTRYDTAERPFSVSELWELPLRGSDSGGLEPLRLAEVTWMNAARYSPDGETILVQAGPSGFGELGRNVPEGRIANDYDGQLYLLDRDSGEARAITRDFDPSVHDAVWSRADGHIYLTAEDGSYLRLYRYRVARSRVGQGSFDELSTGVDVVDEIALADDAPTLVYRGSSVTSPERVMTLDLGSTRPHGVLWPAERYAQVTFGRVEDWDFTMPPSETGGDGTKIRGRIYYPPGFDPSRAEKWPLFVYYYGGTAPTERSFGGRYPKNLWAANDYVVYVLQPSGTTGYGQEFSSRHVNDWGKTVAGEILHGVETLVEEKPFLDRERIGCFGGSYGGFMTLLLVTESDLFAAAISHAGISSISSYWGEGWWGYLYSAVATADSYPWNRPDIYVDQSPLFEADEIDTPLLLLHGTADPNVPPGESEQMYTALQLLGKEVEYVKLEGEAHWILDEPKRRLWWQTILAWLDKHLKDQPQWWQHLWEGGDK